MNNIVPFDFDGNAVRVITDDAGAPWFVAADVCAALGISRTDDGVSRLDDDEKGTGSIRTPGDDQQMTTVNESGLYSLVLGSLKRSGSRSGSPAKCFPPSARQAPTLFRWLLRRPAMS